MTERERLARVFGIEPLRPAGALVMAAVVGLIPMGWVMSSAVVLGLTAIYADEQRKLREGLAEVTGWGFAVSGYREWLLAREPAFDLELRREVGMELLEASFAAIDPSVRIERRGERIVRVVMRRIEIRATERAPSFLAGDRMRLAELRDRVLAPLHADVGIAAMRMGERESLGALVAGPAHVAAGGDAFREQAIVAPPDLQSLAHAGTSQLRPPREAASLELRTDRLLYATAQAPTDAKSMTLAVGGLAITGIILGPLGFVAGAAVGSGVAYAMRQHDHRKLRDALSQATRWPFPVEGYDDWLLSGRPVCDIEFRSPPARADVERTLRTIARVADITWLAETLLRMESHPVVHTAAQGIASFWGGDPRELQLVARRVLTPLHHTVGVVAVRMGGYLDRRV
jgi:hypothetical protein